MHVGNIGFIFIPVTSTIKLNYEVTLLKSYKKVRPYWNVEDDTEIIKYCSGISSAIITFWLESIKLFCLLIFL